MDIPERAAASIADQIETAITDALADIDPDAIDALQREVDARLDQAGRGAVTIDRECLRAPVWLALQGVAKARARTAVAQTEARLGPRASGTTVRAALAAVVGLGSHTALEARIGITTPADRRAYRAAVEAARGD